MRFNAATGAFIDSFALPAVAHQEGHLAITFVPNASAPEPASCSVLIAGALLLFQRRRNSHSQA